MIEIGKAFLVFLAVIIGFIFLVFILAILF